MKIFKYVFIFCFFSVINHTIQATPVSFQLWEVMGKRVCLFGDCHLDEQNSNLLDYTYSTLGFLDKTSKECFTHDQETDVLVELDIYEKSVQKILNLDLSGINPNIKKRYTRQELFHSSNGISVLDRNYIFTDQGWTLLGKIMLYLESRYSDLQSKLHCIQFDKRFFYSDIFGKDNILVGGQKYKSYDDLILSETTGGDFTKNEYFARIDSLFNELLKIDSLMPKMDWFMELMHFKKTMVEKFKGFLDSIGIKSEDLFIKSLYEKIKQPEIISYMDKHKPEKFTQERFYKLICNVILEINYFIAEKSLLLQIYKSLKSGHNVIVFAGEDHTDAMCKFFESCNCRLLNKFDHKEKFRPLMEKKDFQAMAQLIEHHTPAWRDFLLDKSLFE